VTGVWFSSRDLTTHFQVQSKPSFVQPNMDVHSFFCVFDLRITAVVQKGIVGSDHDEENGIWNIPNLIFVLFQCVIPNRVETMGRTKRWTVDCYPFNRLNESTRHWTRGDVPPSQ